MRIDSASLLQAMLSVPVKRVEATGFAPEMQAAAGPTPAPSVAPVQSVEMLVALAATSPDAERRRQMAQEAEDGLSQLEQLQRELAAGKASQERIKTLRDWARKRSRPDEPQLAEIVEEIELRILVELAKQERR